MPPHLVQATPRQQQYKWVEGRGPSVDGLARARSWRLSTLDFRRSTQCEPLNDRMSHEFDAQLRHPRGIPILFERDDAEQQVHVPGELVNATGSRGPRLGRDILDN